MSIATPPFRTQPIGEPAARVLDAIISLTEREGRSPTFQEIATYVGRSINPIQEAVAKLAAAGYIERQHGARGFRVLRTLSGTVYFTPRIPAGELRIPRPAPVDKPTIAQLNALARVASIRDQDADELAMEFCNCRHDDLTEAGARSILRACEGELAEATPMRRVTLSADDFDRLLDALTQAADPDTKPDFARTLTNLAREMVARAGGR